MSFDWFNLDSMLSFDTPEESTYLLQAAGWSTGETSSSFLVKGRCPVAAQQQQQKSLLVMCRLAEFRESLTHDSMGKIMTRELTQSHDSRVVTRESNESTLESKVNEI